MIKVFEQFEVLYIKSQLDLYGHSGEFGFFYASKTERILGVSLGIKEAFSADILEGYPPEVNDYQIVVFHGSDPFKTNPNYVLISVGTIREETGSVSPYVLNVLNVEQYVDFLRLLKKLPFGEVQEAEESCDDENL